MANTITSQTILNGSRNLIVKTTITGDGSGEESNTVLIDASAFDTSDIKIMSVTSSLTGFSFKLSWDATANVDALVVSERDTEQCFRKIGGLVNNSGAGKTGDILISSTGLGSGDEGYVILNMKKKNAA